MKLQSMVNQLFILSSVVIELYKTIAMSSLKSHYLIGGSAFEEEKGNGYIAQVAPWEHSFWGGQRFKFSEDETIFPTKPTVVNPLLMPCFSRYHNSS